nr:hypothetical protein [Fodinicola feengrottensis]
MSRTTIGLFAGLLIAIATAVGGFFGFLAAIVFGAVGPGRRQDPGRRPGHLQLPGRQRPPATMTEPVSLAKTVELDDPGQRGGLEIENRVVERIAATAAAEIDAVSGPPRRVLGGRPSAESTRHPGPAPGSSPAGPASTYRSACDGHTAFVRSASRSATTSPNGSPPSPGCRSPRSTSLSRRCPM